MKNVQSSIISAIRKKRSFEYERFIFVCLNVYSKLTIDFEISAKGQFQSKNDPNA